MILTIIIKSFYFFIHSIFYALPYGQGFPDQIYDSATLLKSAIWRWNGVLPVDTMFELLELTMLTLIAVYGIKITLWIIGLVRGSGYHSGSTIANI